MRAALGRLAYEVGATLLRLCGYIGSIAILGIAIARFLEGGEINAAAEPAARTAWIAEDRSSQPFVVEDWIEAPDRPKLRSGLTAP